MASLDTNFLARPDLFVSTGEKGRTITIQPTPRKASFGGFEEEKWNVVGWNDINFSDDFFTILSAELAAWGVRDVTPGVSDNRLDFLFHAGVNEENHERYMRVLNFIRFIGLNPAHVKAMNLRAANENVLPQQVIIQYPDIFSGYSTQKVIDIASKKTAYQYQNGIITITDCDMILSRNCNIHFNCAFNVEDGDQQFGIVNQENQLYIDITIDKYLSLEKALIENLK